METRDEPSDDAKVLKQVALDYEGLKQLALELRRPAETLIALNDNNDPFYITPARRRAADWFANLWHELEIPTAHYRRIHYLLVSLAKPVLMSNGQPYRNTHECWKQLNPMARDAVYLGLVPPDAYVDRRNAEPVIYEQSNTRLPASVGVPHSSPDISMRLEMMGMPHLPKLHFSAPVIPQPYQVEIWAEKSTVNDVLLPLAERFNLNLQTGVGELSAIYCRTLVARVQEDRRPRRVLYISDFDPAGGDMPVSVARKVEFELHRLGITDADIQVRPVALTHDQCIEHQLPRIPVKDTERRAARFAERFGEGVTELDALEAIHPGLLQRILSDEINRYHDPGHDRAVAAACTDIEMEIFRTDEAVHAECREDIDALQAEFDEIKRAYEAQIADWTERAWPVWDAITARLEERAPDVSEVRPNSGWQAKEELDPLYDSRRDYIEQIDRFKRHQGKPTQRRDHDRPLSMTPNAIRKRKARGMGEPRSGAG